MKLTITIDTANAAFEEAPHDEVARILAKLQARPDWAETLYHGGKIALRDENGNPVGHAKATAE